MRKQVQEGESVFPDQIFSRLAEGMEFNFRQSGPSFTWLVFKSCCFVPYRLGNRHHATWPMVCKCLTLKAALMFGFGHSENKLWTPERQSHKKEYCPCWHFMKTKRMWPLLLPRVQWCLWTWRTTGKFRILMWSQTTSVDCERRGLFCLSSEWLWLI